MQIELEQETKKQKFDLKYSRRAGKTGFQFISKKGGYYFVYCRKYSNRDTRSSYNLLSHIKPPKL